MEMKTQNLGKTDRDRKTGQGQGSMKLFRYLDRLIVAKDEADARLLLRDQYGPLRRGTVQQQRRSVKLSTDNGDTLQNYTPTEAVKAGGRGLIPHY